jgi:hypothetical protein
MFAPPLMSPSATPMPMVDRGYTPQRQRSLSWRAEAGLPPPPSEIDQYQDLHNALVPSSPFGQSPSAYDAHFGGQDENHQQMPMNTVAKHPKLKLKIILASNIFEADGNISGALEVTSSTSQRLRLGEIAVELEAFEGELENK